MRRCIALLAGATASLVASASECETHLAQKIAVTRGLGARAWPVVTITLEPGAGTVLIGSGFELIHRQGDVLAGYLAPGRFHAVSDLPGVVRIERANDYGQIVTYAGGRRAGLRAAEAEPEGTAATEAAWKQMPPLAGPPPTLEAIRAAAKVGVTMVYEDPPPESAQVRRDFEALAGARVLYAGGLPEGTDVIGVPGLVLHLGSTPRVFRVRGDANPLLGRGYRPEMFSKVAEAAWLLEVAPDLVPPSRPAVALVTPEMSAQARSIRTTLDAWWSSPEPGPPAEPRRAVIGWLAELLESARRASSTGEVILKHEDSTRSTTGNNRIRTPYLGAVDLSRAFLLSLERIKGQRIQGMTQPLTQPDLWGPELDLLLRELVQWHAPVVVRDLLLAPGRVLIQDLLERDLRDGFAVTWRIDVVAGHIVGRRSIFNGFLPTAEAAALSTVEGFLSRLTPEERQAFSGGIDIGLMKDGRYIIFELNMGNESGSLYPDHLPLYSNLALSALTGQSTPLIAAMEEAYAKGPLAVGLYLRSYSDARLTHDPSLDLTHTLRSELFREIASRYVREVYAGGKKPKAADRALRKIHTTAQLGENPLAAGSLKQALEELASHPGYR